MSPGVVLLVAGAIFVAVVALGVACGPQLILPVGVPLLVIWRIISGVFS